MENILPKHGGYRNLKSFQVAQLVYDITVRFCDRYIDKKSRTHDQMVQAARSGVQNIAEGSVASGTSKKMELKLTNVARASLEELRLDYEDFLRHRKLILWPFDDPRRKEIVEKRFKTADEVEKWVEELVKKYGQHGQRGQEKKTLESMVSIYQETMANTAHVLTGVASSLLKRQINSLAQAFENEGGFTERLYKIRQQKRKNH